MTGSRVRGVVVEANSLRAGRGVVGALILEAGGGGGDGGVSS